MAIPLLVRTPSSSFSRPLASLRISASTFSCHTLPFLAALPRCPPISAQLPPVRRMTNRPSRSQAPPPPSAASSYCLDCGRVMPAPLADTTTPRKYCSASCRSRSKDRSRTDSRVKLIEAYKELMAKKGTKGVVLCSEAETAAAAELGPVVEQEGKAQTQPQDGREEARRAARRLVNFGWRSQGVEDDREVEAVQDGKNVEASFAKGEWGIRWTDKR